MQAETLGFTDTSADRMGPMETFFAVEGNTKAGHYKCSGSWTEERLAIDYFFRVYPRFNGKAVLVRKAGRRIPGSPVVIFEPRAVVIGPVTKMHLKGGIG